MLGQETLRALRCGDRGKARPTIDTELHLTREPLGRSGLVRMTSWHHRDEAGLAGVVREVTIHPDEMTEHAVWAVEEWLRCRAPWPPDFLHGISDAYLCTPRAAPPDPFSRHEFE